MFFPNRNQSITPAFENHINIAEVEVESQFSGYNPFPVHHSFIRDWRFGSGFSGRQLFVSLSQKPLDIGGIRQRDYISSNTLLTHLRKIYCMLWKKRERNRLHFIDDSKTAALRSLTFVVLGSYSIWHRNALFVVFFPCHTYNFSSTTDFW
jgi:hypothetical protein